MHGLASILRGNLLKMSKNRDFLDKMNLRHYNSISRKGDRRKFIMARKKAAVVEAVEVVEVVETKKATRKPAVKSSVFVQFAGKEIVEKDVVAACKKAYADLATGEDLKTLEVYINVEEGAAYFVANGVASENYKVEL